MTEFFRNESIEEKKDFAPLNSTNFIKNFYKKIELEEANFISLRKPFCGRCAKLDFQDSKERAIKEAERKSGFVDFDTLKIKTVELKEYGNEDRFEFIKEQKAMEPTGRLDSGTVIRQNQIGIYHDYKCKIRGCKISIFIPIEYDKQKTKTMPDLSNNIKTETKTNGK